MSIAADGAAGLMTWLGKFRLGEMKFGPREKAWGVAFAAVVVGLTGTRLIVAPRVEASTQARRAWTAMQHELIRLEAERPDVASRRAQVETLRGTVSQTYQDLEHLEEGLLNRGDQDVLLEQLVAERKHFRLQINAVKPLKEELEKVQSREPEKGAATAEEAFYQRLAVQLDVYAMFDDLSEYLRLLETQRPYQRVKGVKVKIEGQEMVRPRALITVETLLADAPRAVAARRREVFAAIEQVASSAAKDPFLAREKPKEEVLATGLELSGIFGEGPTVAAIINGEPYQVGDLIQDKRVVAILADRVVLEQGARRFVLYARRTGE